MSLQIGLSPLTLLVANVFGGTGSGIGGRTNGANRPNSQQQAEIPQ